MSCVVETAMKSLWGLPVPPSLSPIAITIHRAVHWSLTIRASNIGVLVYPKKLAKLRLLTSPPLAFEYMSMCEFVVSPK